MTLFTPDNPNDSRRQGMIYLLEEGDIDDVEGVLANIRQELMDNPNIIAMGTREYFQLFCSGAKFANVEDRVLVGGILERFVKKNPIPCFYKSLEKLNETSQNSSTEKIYWDLGSRCLVSESFFKRFLDKWNLSDFYDSVGRNSFRNAGYISLAESFGDWTSYISENMMAA